MNKSELDSRLRELQNLSFVGKGEASVEQKFLTSLLELLGYDSHKDYEVIRHGDENSNFKLKCPPVRDGNKRQSSYNPDYIPTIRKKMFWVIEAKNPEVNLSKEENATQGLQYCVHPEIQAKYLVLSNGIETKVFDVQKTFLGGDIYEPIFSFTSTELIDRWNDIYNLLSVEKMRGKIEEDIVKQYEKLCASSLDEDYPRRFSNKISRRISSLALEIRKNRAKLQVAAIDEWINERARFLESATTQILNEAMEYPMVIGGERTVASIYYVEKLRQQGKSPDAIFEGLTADYGKQSVFRKQQTFVVLCKLLSNLWTIAKSSLSGIDSIRGTILDPNNKNGIWEEVSSTEVRLKLNTDLTKDAVREIVKGDFDKVWTILQQPHLIKHEPLKGKIKGFLLAEENHLLSSFNKAETSVLRLLKKIFMILIFPKKQEKYLGLYDSLPEIVKFVEPPRAVEDVNTTVLSVHSEALIHLRQLTDKDLEKLNQELCLIETKIENKWKEIIAKIPHQDKELFGFEYYGLGNKCDSLETIVKNFNIQ